MKKLCCNIQNKNIKAENKREYRANNEFCIKFRGKINDEWGMKCSLNL